MKRIRIAFFISIICLLLTASSNNKTTIFIIGDSTAANKVHPETNPERGWGMVLQGCFDERILVDNHAVNGQ
jgi:pectinesterase